METTPHTRIPTEFDSFPYQVVKESPGQSESVAGFGADESTEADEYCMKLNAENTDPTCDYSLEMGGEHWGESEDWSVQ